MQKTRDQESLPVFWAAQKPLSQTCHVQTKMLPPQEKKTEKTLEKKNEKKGGPLSRRKMSCLQQKQEMLRHSCEEV